MKGNIPEVNSIIVFWHGVMLPCWKIFSKYSPVAVVSTSKDGEKLVKILEKWNYSFIRGSSSKRGKEVLDEIIQKVSLGMILMTPDGPRGPNHKFKAGAVVAAQRAKVPLHYMKVEIKSKIIFKKSWDKFEFPYPFSKINIEISESMLIPEMASRDDIDNIILNLEQELL